MLLKIDDRYPSRWGKPIFSSNAFYQESRLKLCINESIKRLNSSVS